jgi:hypothetical protein
MSKITVPVEDADVAKTFIEFLQADWTRPTAASSSIQAVLLIKADQNPSTQQTEIQIQDRTSGHKLIFSFSAPAQLYVDLCKKVKP